MGTRAAPDRMSDVSLVQPLHDTGGRIEAVRASASQHDGIDDLEITDRIERVGLACAWCGTAYIDAADGSRPGEDDRASGRTLIQRDVSNLEPVDRGQGQIRRRRLGRWCRGNGRPTVRFGTAHHGNHTNRDEDGGSRRHSRPESGQTSTVNIMGSYQPFLNLWPIS